MTPEIKRKKTWHTGREVKLQPMERILAICETIDFQNFTRRYTIEALARTNKQTTALCHTHLKNLFNTRLHSDFMEVHCYYGVIPFNRKRGALKKMEYVLKSKWKTFFSGFDVVMMSSPMQNYFLDFMTPDQKLVYLISDPYCLMGGSKEKEAEILSRANLVLGTSKALAQEYIKKYYGEHKSGITMYWPNCVETGVWKSPGFQPKPGNRKPVIGFAGNFMKLVDLALLEKIAKEFCNCDIVICGKISHTAEDFVARVKRIFQYPNVNFKGFIRYNDLPVEVQQWDVCMMLDNISELSSYHHHNKLYQYLAMGKAVVAQRNHHDYDSLSDVIYLADSHGEYLQCLKLALNEPGDKALYEKRIQIALENSADARAEQLKMEILNL